MSRSNRVAASVLVYLMLLGAFFFPMATYADERLTVYTVNYPLAYMAQTIGGNAVDVVFPAPADIDPAYWNPDTETVLAFQKADLILISGADYAKWLSKVSLPKSRIIDTTKEVRDRFILLESSQSHNHGPDGDHSHEGFAFTVWLDFEIAAFQADRITLGLIRKAPDQKTYFENNLKQLKRELQTLDDRLLKLGRKYQTTPLIGSHPVYQYFAKRYEFNVKSVHWEPDQHPGDQQVADLKDLLVTHNSDIMLWEANPEESTQQLLADLGLKSVVFNPSGNRSADGDFLTIMQENVNRLEKALTVK